MQDHKHTRLSSRMGTKIIVLILLALTTTADGRSGRKTEIRYDPTWESLDSRPLPAWYDEAKIGVFVSWGVFSVPSFGNEWFWQRWQGDKNPKYVQYMQDNYKPDFTYADFSSDFTAEFYDAEAWAELFAASGAKYTVFITKHHGGFCNWPTNVSFNWNSMMVGPKRDIVGEMARALKSKTDIHLGLYHSMYEWFNPLYLQDKANNYTTTKFPEQKTIPELYELVNSYEPDLLWSDGDWDAPDTYWGSKEFLAWLYNDSPVKDKAVVNDRWGKGDECHHGGYLTCSDRFNPGVLQPRKWEGGLTIDKASWGFRREAVLADYLTMEEIITRLVQVVSCGGNLVINVSPTKYGMISPIYEERLRQMGDWLKLNGEAIYSSKPWVAQNDTVTPGVWYTQKGGTVYAIVLNWPQPGQLILGSALPKTGMKVSLLGYTEGSFSWQNASPKGISITIPPIPVNQMPCQWAWVFAMA
ncbi:alpha-L-fucosidase-like isoform X1 [Haliotis rubra]|uniref:alpha-L-fucosidase-like isoform X1 n=1 Tax=Haliotis rubra TaxID=36100 RepID=UPI001EE504D0|nr:alpha-L-fucosidase-like isoform X1 [Haliotis rubra]